MADGQNRAFNECGQKSRRSAKGIVKWAGYALVLAIGLMPLAVAAWPWYRGYWLDLYGQMVWPSAFVWLLAGGGMMITKRWRMGLLWGVSSLGAIVIVMAGRWPQTLNPVSSGVELTVVSYNYHGKYVHGDDRFRQWVNQLDADLVSLVEFQETDERENAWLGERYQYRIRAGNAVVMSHYPLRILPMLWPREDQKYQGRWGTWGVVVTLGSGQVMVWVPQHLASPRTKELWEVLLRRSEQTGELAHLYQSKLGCPMIVAGDFNSTHEGEGYKRYKAASGLKDGHRGLLGLGTWPSELWTGLSLPIDHLFVSDHVEVDSYGVGPALSSDHRPIWAKLRVGKSGQADEASSISVD